MFIAVNERNESRGKHSSRRNIQCRVTRWNRLRRGRWKSEYLGKKGAKTCDLTCAIAYFCFFSSRAHELAHSSFFGGCKYFRSRRTFRRARFCDVSESCQNKDRVFKSRAVVHQPPTCTMSQLLNTGPLILLDEIGMNSHDECTPVENKFGKNILSINYLLSSF